MLNLFGIPPSELELLISAQFPKYRAQQLLGWMYHSFLADTDKMTNLPADLKQYLKDNYSLYLPRVVTQKQSQDGSSKYLLQLYDGLKIECVLIPEAKKNTLCVSTQVGCAKGCVFCSTAQMKLIRNLDASEIVGQFIVASQELKQSRITNLVFMGMGEPLDNSDNVFKALQILQSEQGISFSPRRTTLSTCGVVPQIIAMADNGIKAKLAVSLNSAINDKRSQIMPINNQYPLAQLKQALLYYLRKSRFRITIEYILIPEINMGMEDIEALRKFVGDLSCKINFIPYNPSRDSLYTAPTAKQTDEFMFKASVLPQAIMLRKSRGADILGACGQLLTSKSTNPIPPTKF